MEIVIDALLLGVLTVVFLILAKSILVDPILGKLDELIAALQAALKESEGK